MGAGTVSVGRSLTEYQCHKVVRAAKIEHIVIRDDADLCHLEFADGGGLDLGIEYATRHRPQVGGYYVVYADGYASYSPPEPFEQGYTLLSEARVPRFFEPGCWEHSDRALELRNTYQPPKSRSQIRAHEWVSKLAAQMAKDLVKLCPPGRGLSLALTRVDEMRMWANKAIAEAPEEFMPEP